jgi:hypothetical protein
MNWLSAHGFHEAPAASCAARWNPASESRRHAWASAPERPA